MIVLHAAFRSPSLLIWGEASDSPKNFSASPSDLAAAISTTNTAAWEAVAWLPTIENRPVPSSALIAEQPASTRAAYLAPWIVAVIPLDPPRVVNILTVWRGKHPIQPGVVAGDDLAYWMNALQFAASLVARGQFLPGVASRDRAIEARWKPVFPANEAGHIQSLVDAMPSSARALTWKSSDRPPEIAAGRVLREFIEVTLDALIRTCEPPGSLRKLDSIHDRWMHALTSADPVITGDASELKNLETQIRQWQQPIRVSERAPFRLCFRLEEPPDGSPDWQVRYLMQGARDPSLLVPAQDAWTLKGKAAAALGKDAPAIRELLLGSLGQAAAICPRIETSLRERTPAGYQLDATGAHDFLTMKASALEQSGFGIMLPGWWTRRGTQARLTAKASVKSPVLKGGSGISLESIVDFQWEIALGDEKLTLRELTALARMKAPLVKLRGQWIEADGDRIRAAIEFLKKHSSNTSTAREIVQMALGSNASAGPLEISGVSATGWVADLLAQLEGQSPFEELPQPEGLRGTLRPYQIRGYSWLHFLKRWGLGACLADDMGLGKTIQTLALIERDYRDENASRPVLLICPTSVVGNWQKETARFTDLPVLVHHGIARNKGAQFQKLAAGHAIVLSTYSLLHRDLEILKEVPWAGLILDEAQNIKNAETKQARAARSVRADYRIALTGTPVENNVGDLWSLMECLNPGFLGSQAEFKKRFFLPIQVWSDQGAADRLKRLTGPFILRRLKTDKTVISDLPDKLEMKVFCTLTKEQASLYAAVVKDAQQAIEEAEGIKRKGVVLATLSKLKQVCNHPAQFLKDHSAIPGRSGKLARLTEMMEEILEVGDRSLVFTQFAEMGELLRRHLQETFGREVLFLHGGTSKKQRDTMVERFAKEDGPRIFLLSLKAGGTGLNLVQANHVFHFDRWWNPAVENQATDRAFRIGQTKNVQVHKFLCAGTLEDKIDEMIERKKDIAGRVVGTGEGWLTGFSNAALKDLFALRKEAIGE